MRHIWDREPTLILNAIKALIAVAMGFGLEISVEQFALIMVAITAVMAVVNRQSVYAPDTVAVIWDKIQQQAKNEGRSVPPEPPPAL